MIQPLLKFLLIIILTSSCSKVLIYEKLPNSYNNSISSKIDLFVLKENDSIIALKGYYFNGQMTSNKSNVDLIADSIVYFDTAFVMLKDSTKNNYTYSKINYVSNNFLSNNLKLDTNEYFYYYDVLRGSTPVKVTIVDTLVYRNQKLLLLYNYTGGTAGPICQYYLVDLEYKNIPNIVGNLRLNPNQLESEREVAIAILKKVKSRREFYSLLKYSQIPMLEHPLSYSEEHLNFQYFNNDNAPNPLNEIKTLFEESALRHISKVFNK